MSFNNEITSHTIRLLDNVQSLRLMGGSLFASLGPGTSNYFAACGAQVSTPGKHYWELQVENSKDWAVGLGKESWIRKNGTWFDWQDPFLLSYVKEGNHYPPWTTTVMSRQSTEKPVGQLGVFLDVTVEVRVRWISRHLEVPRWHVQFPCHDFHLHGPHVRTVKSET